MNKGQTFGERVRQARRQAGLRLQDVAKAIGRSPSWLSQVERGLTWGGEPPAYSDLLGIAKALGVSIGALTDGHEEGDALHQANFIDLFHQVTEASRTNGIFLPPRDHELFAYLARCLLAVRRWPVPVVSAELLARGELEGYQGHELLEVPLELLGAHRWAAAIAVAGEECAPWALPGDYLLVDHSRDSRAATRVGALVVLATSGGTRITRITSDSTVEDESIGLYINTYPLGRRFDFAGPSTATGKRVRGVNRRQQQSAQAEEGKGS